MNDSRRDGAMPRSGMPDRTPDKDRAARPIQVAVVEGESLADPQAGASKQHDQRSKSVAIGSLADRGPAPSLATGWFCPFARKGAFACAARAGQGRAPRDGPV